MGVILTGSVVLWERLGVRLHFTESPEHCDPRALLPVGSPILGVSTLDEERSLRVLGGQIAGGIAVRTFAATGSGPVIDIVVALVWGDGTSCAAADLRLRLYDYSAARG